MIDTYPNVDNARECCAKKGSQDLKLHLIFWFRVEEFNIQQICLSKLGRKTTIS